METMVGHLYGDYIVSNSNDLGWDFGGFCY
jgi:hypothetical protein